MKSRTVKGIEISALSLGTVQLGVNYGINNSTGKPDQRAAFDILNCAVENGITALDTAAAYGDSEQVIGQWLHSEARTIPFVMTKAKHLDHSSLSALRTSLREQVEQSKRRLGLEQLPLLMLHSCDEYLGDEENVKTVFDELKANGDIRFSGISAYAHHDYSKIADSGFDATQIPLNVFDWRQIDNGGLEKLEDSGMMVFVRSVYLQGLVFKKPEELDPRMEYCRHTLETYQELCRQYALSPATLALSYALSLPGVTSLVLGSETVEQVQQNIELLNHVIELNPDQLQQLHDCFCTTDYRMLTPSTWFNA